MTVAHAMVLALSLVGCQQAAPPPEPFQAPVVVAPPAPTVATPETGDTALVAEAHTGAVPDEPSAEQRDAYDALRPKNVLDNFLFRATTHAGAVSLVDVAPNIGVWFTLSVNHAGVPDTFHLENPRGTAQTLALDGDMLRVTRDGVSTSCDLWGGSPSALEAARASKRVYAPLCDGALYLRNPALGAKTPLEWSTDFLRDHVWGGEQLTNAVKTTVYADAERREASLDGTAAAPSADQGPAPAAIAPGYVDGLVDTPDLGLPYDGAPAGRAALGAWYPIHGVPGLWGGAIAARYLDPAVFERTDERTNTLSAGELDSIDYVVAIDLNAFELGYEVGTDHPRVGWSERMPSALRDPGMPGPDGFADVAPLVRTGELDPDYQARFAAVFVGGFKRLHGAFREGDLAGKHYGFVEYGAELSKLVPGYATFIVWDDGRVELKTWTEEDEAQLSHVRHARQNGVPVLQTDPDGVARPGELVSDYQGGNWAASVEGELRSVRAGVCMQDSPRGRYLLYVWFSSATPSGMADVMAAYGCSYGMLLDMNALEHTYMAVDVPDGKGAFDVDHLITGMDVLDRQRGSVAYQRFVGFADNRDFFYVLRKDTP